jgi:hypothetical protein
MRFRVIWAPEAEDQLAKLLAVASDPDQLVAAANLIDRKLIAGPKDLGESRDEAVRVGFVQPFGIQFEVMDDVQTVIVHDIWRTDRRQRR